MARSNISGPTLNFATKYIFEPNCKKGACATKVTSPGRYGFTARAAFVKGHYRWARVDASAYTCKATGSTVPIPANKAYALQGTKVRLVAGQWVISRFTGEADFTGTKSGGCYPLASERYILKGSRKS